MSFRDRARDQDRDRERERHRPGSDRKRERDTPLHRDDDRYCVASGLLALLTAAWLVSRSCCKYGSLVPPFSHASNACWPQLLCAQALLVVSHLLVCAACVDTVSDILWRLKLPNGDGKY